MIAETSQANSPLRKRTVAADGPLKFAGRDGFQAELRNRVQAYFDTTGLPVRDCARMYVKTAIIMAWLAGSYVLLVGFATTWWQALPLAISLGMAMSAVGFSIQHDGGHGAYSGRSWINRAMALTLDLLGGSSYVWAKKHNSVHHTYSNITDHDDDINIGFFGRLSPHQPRYWVHRWQHIYLWALYGLLPIKWQLYDDFRDVLLGRVGQYRFPRPRGLDLVIFVGGKVIFFALAFALPLYLHSAWAVLGCYLAASFAQGVALSVVFQLAHCVEEAAFPLPNEDTGKMENAWAIHQVQTTVDFAQGNRWLSWFCGGLNFQIEHHLFPQICHLHYPAIAPIVEQTCQDFGITYSTHVTFRSSLASHYRWLKRMAKQGVETCGSKDLGVQNVGG